MNIDEMRQCAPQAVSLLKVLANENRLFILCSLIDGEVSVNELVAKLQLSQSAMSQHLALLRENDFVTTRKQAQVVYYSLSSPEIKKMMSVLRELYGSNQTANENS